jgi:hypothetical protein
MKKSLIAVMSFACAVALSGCSLELSIGSFSSSATHAEKSSEAVQAGYVGHLDVYSTVVGGDGQRVKGKDLLYSNAMKAKTGDSVTFFFAQVNKKVPGSLKVPDGVGREFFESPLQVKIVYMPVKFAWDKGPLVALIVKDPSQNQIMHLQSPDGNVVMLPAISESRLQGPVVLTGSPDAATGAVSAMAVGEYWLEFKIKNTMIGQIL